MAATVSGFSLAEAGGRFVLNAVVGIAIGIAVGYVVARLRKGSMTRRRSPISLVTPYFAYLPAEALGVSAVLAAVTTGIYLAALAGASRRPRGSGLLGVGDPRLRPQRRALHARRTPAPERHRRDQPAVDELAPRGRRVVSAAVIVIRFLWVFRHVRAAPARAACVSASPPSIGSSRPSGWTGYAARCPCRGAGHPQTIDGGGASRSATIIIFLTYAVILVTLILQGLTLPGLIKVLGVEDDGNLEQRSQGAHPGRARRLDRIEELRGQDWVRTTPPTACAASTTSASGASRRASTTRTTERSTSSPTPTRACGKVLEAERAEIIRLRNVGKINDEIMRRLERDLDLEDTRLEV